MFAILALLFVLLPLAELFLLLQMASHVGGLPTFALVIFTGVVGAWLAREEGFRTLTRINEEMAAGRMPTDSLLDAGMILVAGAMLVTPGIMTDCLGFSLLIPPCRRLYRKLLGDYLKKRVKVQTFTSTSSNSFSFGQQEFEDQNVVDGQVVSKD